MYVVCQRKLAPALPIFHAGGMTKKLSSAPDSSMEVAKGILTTSHLKLSAWSFAKKDVSLMGPRLLPYSPDLHWEIWELVHFKILVALGLKNQLESGGENAPCTSVSRRIFGEDRIGRTATGKGKLASMRWIVGTVFQTSHKEAQPWTPLTSQSPQAITSHQNLSPHRFLLKVT